MYYKASDKSCRTEKGGKNSEENIIKMCDDSEDCIGYHTNSKNEDFFMCINDRSEADSSGKYYAKTSLCKNKQGMKDGEMFSIFDDKVHDYIYNKNKKDKEGNFMNAKLCGQICDNTNNCQGYIYYDRFYGGSAGCEGFSENNFMCKLAFLKEDSMTGTEQEETYNDLNNKKDSLAKDFDFNGRQSSSLKCDLTKDYQGLVCKARFT